MDLDDDVLSASLAAAAAEADEAESSVVATRTVQRDARNGVVTVDGSVRERQLALRVWLGQREAFGTYAADIAPSVAARQILELAQALPPTRSPPPAPVVRIAPMPPASPDDMPELLEQLRGLSLPPRGGGIDIELKASHVTREVHLRALSGFDGRRYESYAVISTRVVSRVGHVAAQVWYETCEPSLASAVRRVETEVLPEALAQARAAVGAARLDARPASVVIEARLMARMLGLLAPSLMLESVQLRRSNWGDRRGQRVGVPGLRIADDPAPRNGAGAIPFDDEGMPTRCNVLIDDGIMRELLCDRQAASREGTQSNGSGWRGPAGEAPATRARFLELDGRNGLAWQADHPRDCVPGTLWVQQAHGMHMANDITGNFSFAASGVVADGSSTGRPVHGFTVTGNAHEMLQHIEGVSRCSHLIKSSSGFLRSPHARITGLTVVALRARALYAAHRRLRLCIKPIQFRRKAAFSMSHILIVGSGYEAFRRYILEGAARTEAILLNPAPITWQAPFVRSAHHVDFRDREALYATAHTLASEHDIGGIVTWDETLLQTSADLGVQLGVQTISPAAAGACRDKAVQRAAFARAGVPSVRFQVVRSPADAADAAADIGFPVVIKPTSLAGSVGVCVVRSPAEIRAAWEVATSGSYSSLAGSAVMIEEMMVGPEISVDCWMLDGVCTPVVVAYKQTGFSPYFEEIGHMVGASLAADIEGLVLDAVSKANLALGIDRCVTHTEVILTAKGPRIVEVNGRLGGGLIPFLAQLAAPGLSIWQVLAAVARGMPGELVPSCRVVGIRFLYPPDDLAFERIDISPELQGRDWIDRIMSFCEVGTELRLPPRGFLSRAGYVIVTGADRAAVEDRFATIDKYVTVIGTALNRPPSLEKPDQPACAAISRAGRVASGPGKEAQWRASSSSA